MNPLDPSTTGGDAEEKAMHVGAILRALFPSLADEEVAVLSDVLEAWARGQTLSVHGWVYSIANGLIRDLNVSVSEPG